MDRRSDLAALDRWFASAVVTGNEQHDPVPARDRVIESAVDRDPSLIEIVTVEVEDAIGFDIARQELAVPTAVQRHTGRGSSGSGTSWRADRRFDNRPLSDRLLSFS